MEPALLIVQSGHVHLIVSLILCMFQTFLRSAIVTGNPPHIYTSLSISSLTPFIPIQNPDTITFLIYQTELISDSPTKKGTD